MPIWKIILIVLGVLFLLFILMLYIALAPTIRNLSNRKYFKRWVNKPVTLKKPANVYLYDKGSYRFNPHVLVSREQPGFDLRYTLPVGTTITLRQFKTYKNNAGSGFTTLFVLGDFVNEKGETIPFEYGWDYEGWNGSTDQTKLPRAIWQGDEEELLPFY